MSRDFSSPNYHIHFSTLTVTPDLNRNSKYVRYCGVPSCAYEIGFFTLSKDAVLSFADRMDTEVIERVLDGLDKAGYESEEEPVALTISMPRDFFTEQSMNNLLQLISVQKNMSRFTGNSLHSGCCIYEKQWMMRSARKPIC